MLNLLVLLTWILLSPIAARAAGGVMGVPPYPNQMGANLITSNSGFESGFSGWSNNACASVADDAAHGGTQSVKFVGCNAPTGALQKSVTLGGARQGMHLRVSGWLKSTSDFNGTFRFYLVDTTRGSVTIQAEQTRTSDDDATGGFIAGQDWMYHDIEYIMPEELQADTWQFRLRVEDQTAGTAWADDFEITETWVPLRTFLKYPNYRGFLWEDVNPWQCSDHSVAEICGVSEISPRMGESLGDYKLIVELGTTAGCANPVDSLTIDPVSVSVEGWSFDGSGLALDTPHYICTELQLIGGSSVVATYADWQIEKKDTGYRAALRNYIDDRGRWWHNYGSGLVARFPWGAYARWSGTHGCTGCIWPAGVTCLLSPVSDCYKYMISGYSRGGLPVATVKSMRTSWLADSARARHSTMLAFSPISGIDPRDSGSDQLDPLLDAWGEFKQTHIQISNFRGYQLSQSNTPQPPDPPALDAASSGGAIGAVNVWVKVSATTMRPTVRRNNEWNQTGVSTAVSTGVLSGSTNIVTVHLAACPQTSINGWFVYAATTADATPPPASSYTRQHAGPVYCDRGDYLDFELTRVDAGGRPAPTSDGTDMGRSSWGSFLTDEQMWGEFGSHMSASNYGAALYTCDECVPEAAGWNYLISKYIRENYQGMPTLGITGEHPTGNLYYRDVFDIPSADPYGYQQAQGPLQRYYASGERPASLFHCDVPNGLATDASAFVNKVDIFADSLARITYGSRPSWTVVQQWWRVHSQCGFPYAELSRQAWKAIIAQQNRGSIGGLLTWGWVSVQGLEDAVLADGHTQAFEDHVRLGNELMDIEDVLLESPRDSSALGTGIVVSAVSSSISLPTGTCTGYTSPVRFVTKQMPSGEQWVLATNLCIDSHTVTFTLANPPAGALVAQYPSGTLHPLSSNQFTDTWSDFDVHVYRIFTPTGSKTRTH